MIESIYQIGKAARQGTSGRRAFLESLAKPPPKPKRGTSSIAILKLNTITNTLNVEVRELSEEGDHSSSRYLWIGNAGSNSDQDRLTTDNLAYLASQTILNLLDRVTVRTPLYETLSKLKKYYLDIGERDEVGSKDKGAYRRYRYLWDLEKFQISGPMLRELKDHVRETETAKLLPHRVADALQKHFKAQLGNDQILYTLEVDGKLLINDEDYHRYLEGVLVDAVFEDAEVGCCHLSGQQEPLSTNMKKFDFKYYTNDKQGFATGTIPKGFRSSLAISRNAYISLLVGERFVRREMKFSLAGTNGYIVPDFHAQEMSREFISDLEKALKDIKNRTLLNMGLQSLDDLMYDEIKSESGYMLNLLFYKQSKSNFKVIRLIRDVPDYRLGELRVQAMQTKEKIGDILYGESNQWLLTLQRMYYLLPVRKSGTDRLSKGVLEFYDTLISGGLIDRTQLVERFMELTHVYRFSNYAAYHISEPQDADYTLVTYNAQSNLLLAFLREQGQLKEENVDLSYLDELHLDETQYEYLRHLRYTHEQAALYFLGMLIGEIANAQYRLGAGGKGGKKTILNKLNYQGMTLSRVQRLTTEIFDKLRQYRDNKRRPLLQARTEKIFAQAQQLLTEGSADSTAWTLTPTENVYYLLSGYSHTTLQAIKAGALTQDSGESDNDATKMKGAQV